MLNKKIQKVEYYKNLNTLYIYYNDNINEYEKETASISIITIPTEGKYLYHNEIVMTINTNLGSGYFTEQEIMEENNKKRKTIELDLFKDIVPQEELDKLEYQNLQGNMVSILSTMAYSNTNYVSNILNKLNNENISVIPITDVLLEDTLQDSPRIK